MNTNKVQDFELGFPEIIDLICFSIVCSRNLMDEPKIYGPLRILTLSSKLIEILPPDFQDKFGLSGLLRNIEKAKDSVIEGEGPFLENLDFLVSEVLILLEKRTKEEKK